MAILAKFRISESPYSPDIGQNTDWGISNFWISGQSLIKENCPNSSTSDDIDMKLGPVTKLDKGNNKRQKNIDDVMSENCDVIVFPDLWPIWSNPEAGFPTNSLQNLYFH